MKKAIILIICFYASMSYSQTTFEKGFYINNQDQTISCFIKNLDWLNNPDKIQYKLTLSSEPKTILLDDVKEFSILGKSKYIRATVQLDKSSNKIDFLSNRRTPDFEIETLFLKILVEGKADLYEYRNGNLKRYFYRIDEGIIKPLVYKKYATSQSYVRENKLYQQQLKDQLKCEGLN